uniref:Uncharacterized protein n=1 Tax=Leersia perrieri TaxID=77586 RepID=A0A0D9WTV9_9ORYZ
MNRRQEPYLINLAYGRFTNIVELFSSSCEDPQSCRQQISEDFKNEAPLWKLTCYAHLRSGPCDIKGDISFEELRAKAYEEGKQGHSLQSIVEGERNLQNAKLMEFTNLLNSTRPSQTPNFPTMNSFPEVKNSSPFGASQTNGPPVFNSFSQIGPGTITTGVPANSPFGQQTSAPHAAPTFGSSQMKFGVSTVFGNQGSRQPFGSFQAQSSPSINSYPKSSPASSVQHRDIDRQSQELLNGMMAPPTSVIDDASVGNNKNENQDDSIWLKEKWAIGEVFNYDLTSLLTGLPSYVSTSLAQAPWYNKHGNRQKSEGTLI